MSDDLGKKIKQITDLLGQDNLKSLLGVMMNASTGNKEDTSPKPDETVQENKPSRDEVPVLNEPIRNEPVRNEPVRNEQDDTMDMMRKVKKVMDRANMANDPRMNLLNAIRPFLNNTRQKKLNNCLKVLQMSRMAGLIDDKDQNQ